MAVATHTANHFIQSKVALDGGLIGGGGMLLVGYFQNFCNVAFPSFNKNNGA